MTVASMVPGWVSTTGTVPSASFVTAAAVAEPSTATRAGLVSTAAPAIQDCPETTTPAERPHGAPAGATSCRGRPACAGSPELHSMA